MRIPDSLSLKEKCNYIKSLSLIEFNIVLLRNFFLNKVLIEKKKNNIDFKMFSFLFFLQQKRKNKQKKYYVKGRILNRIRGGFAIGISGYIGFLPLSHTLLKHFGRVTLFHMLSIDTEKRILMISQMKINGILRRQLKKLGSRFINFEKNIPIKILR
uniref:Ribosomal protein S1 n=1 Tax=Chroomonas placoidea TaxID=173977 RepID=A0A2P1G821_9CRYP|nr:ribosomal protein S1 [Chroomonas placoidea]AVM81105.1 ribosomal protein S1 [Chroomonas placoidea]